MDISDSLHAGLTTQSGFIAMTYSFIARRWARPNAQWRLNHKLPMVGWYLVFGRAHHDSTWDFL